MSTHRTNPKAGWTDYDKLPRGPNGRGLCRHCGIEAPKGRRTFCSDTCVHEWKIRTNPGYARAQVFQRDHGICQQCGIDTVLFQQTVHRLPFAERQAAKQARGFTPYGHLWEADHIVPVVEGGGECGLEGYRTLCTPCHKAATKALRARLKGRATTQLSIAIASLPEVTSHHRNCTNNLNQGDSHEDDR